MLFKKSFPHYNQVNTMDCGPTCLRMIAKYYGKSYSLAMLRDRSHITKEGVSMLGVSEAAESIGFRTLGVRITLDQLRDDMPLPCILHWNQNHFVVCYDIRKSKKGYNYYIADPATDLLSFNDSEINKCWLSSKSDGLDVGMALALTPSSIFIDYEDSKILKKSNGFRFLLKYLTPYKTQLFQLFLGLILISSIQLIFPFLTQSLVDIGIKNKELNFITLVLIAQLFLTTTQLVIDFIRSWIFLHMNARINIALISDFLIKLMNLPMRFFESRMIGDVLQRIGDHRRVEAFLTGTSITTIFSLINFVLFSFLLYYYSPLILLIYFIGNSLYIGWILLFLKRRKELDIHRFAQASGEQSNLIQLVTAMQDIKLNNCERPKRWQWEQIQVKLFKIQIKGLALGQFQQSGSIGFNQTTNILISFIAATMVVEGELTLGMMMGLTYILGQLNGPVNSIIVFIQQFQDAKISLDRLNEVHDVEDEIQEFGLKAPRDSIDGDISLKNVFFSYDGSDRNYVLNNINLKIPQGKITAIVGASGSGKTTLMKLLLGFFKPNNGEINIGEMSLYDNNPRYWRAICGVVMQEGFIYSDTIANNIALGEDSVNLEKLSHAVKMANIDDFIDSLPLGYNTKIGMEGNGVSQGQKQRILIARAIYKNPDYLFFDEATNALDSKNEKDILKSLKDFYIGKTVFIIAHRLSTVRDADNIIVLENGHIVEQGNHFELVNNKGVYYKLIKSQMLE